jgi:ActR/RegA family two-component response regulator
LAEDAGAPVAALVDDLMFLSRIREAAKRNGRAVQAARSVADVVGACRGGARTVVVDLDSARLPVMDALAALAGDSTFADVEVIGFFSHVDVARARAAEAAGCRTVLPRSAFVRKLDELLG